MLIRGKITQEVDVNPLDFIEKLKSSELGHDKSYVFTRDNKFYQSYWTGGTHGWEEIEEISKEKYEVIVALIRIEDYLKQKK